MKYFFNKWLSKEVIVHSFLWVLYFLVIAYQKDLMSARTGEPAYLQIRDFVFTLNYFLVILIINYWLLPKYFYSKRYISFFAFSSVVLVVAILIEEFVMEQVFYANTPRAQNFPGFFPTLLQIGPTIVFFVGFKFAWDNLQKQSALEQLQKEKVESQLQFLKSQLNPHFLFNNLNNLYSYAQEKSPKTPEIILQLSAIMRYMLYESHENFVPLQKELDYVGDFIRLQELQMENRGKVEFCVKGNTHSKMIAPMILMAFVENCFKHSLSSHAENIAIKIQADIKEDHLIFKASNTFSEVVNSSDKYLTKGIGLDNVRKRLDLLYPGRYDLKTHTEEDVYFVDLNLDLRVDQKNPLPIN